MPFLIIGIIIFFLIAKPLIASKKNEAFYDPIIGAKASEYRIEKAIVKAITKKESNFNPRAVNPSDPSYGLMQITPALAKDYNLIEDDHALSDEDIERIFDVENNLDCGCRYLSFLLLRLSFSGAIQAYNVGYQGYLKGSRNVNYLTKVVKFYNGYK